MAATEKVLISFDTDRIKDYVFSSSKLAEIRGASAMLDRLNRTETKAILDKHHAKEIFIGGGSALAIADRSSAAKLISEVEELYRETTKTGSITGVQVDLPPGYNGEKFDQYFRQASAKLRSRKMRRSQQTSLVDLPQLATCGSCGRYPAESYDQDDLLCSACLIKRNRGRFEHRGRVGLMQEFSNRLINKDPEWEEADMAADFTEIGSVSRGCPGYIGLIYCDGNRMGDLLSQQKTMEDYRLFSDLVDRSLRESTEVVLQSLRPRRLPDKKSAIFPFEIIMLGGDDLILVTVADKALEVAAALAAGFEEKTCQKSPAVRLSLSVGVTIAHASYPFYAILDTAEELLKSAKMRSFELNSVSNKGLQGAVDFMVITNTSGLSVKQLRKEEFSYLDGAASVSLSERPYSIEQVEHMVATIKKLKDSGFPQNKLQELYESIFQSKSAAMYQALVTMGRLDPKHQKILKEYFGEYAIDQYPWRQDGQSFVTPIGDLIEAYAFVGNEVKE